MCFNAGQPSYTSMTLLYLNDLSRLGQHYGRTRDGSIFGSPSVASFVQGSS